MERRGGVEEARRRQHAGDEERDGGTGQPDVSEQSERWRLIDWFVGGRIISRTRTEHHRHTLDARLIAFMASLRCTCITGNTNGRGRGRKLVM